MKMWRFAVSEDVWENLGDIYVFADGIDEDLRCLGVFLLMLRFFKYNQSRDLT